MALEQALKAAKEEDVAKAKHAKSQAFLNAAKNRRSSTKPSASPPPPRPFTAGEIQRKSELDEPSTGSGARARPTTSAGSTEPQIARVH